MSLMDRGTLAAAIRSRAFVSPEGRIRAVSAPRDRQAAVRACACADALVTTDTRVCFCLAAVPRAAPRHTLCACAARCQASLLRRCADIAAGLFYLHERNVCHGDLKTENVLLRTGVFVVWV
jgi:streptomycin 6-kinase